MYPVHFSIPVEMLIMISSCIIAVILGYKLGVKFKRKNQAKLSTDQYLKNLPKIIGKIHLTKESPFDYCTKIIGVENIETKEIYCIKTTGNKKQRDLLGRLHAKKNIKISFPLTDLLRETQNDVLDIKYIKIIAE